MLFLCARINGVFTQKPCTSMYRNTPDPNQQTLKFEDFHHPFGIKLNSENRWVRLSKIIPWSDYEMQYAQQLSNGIGAPALSFRTALGSLIVKEMLGLSDRATVEQITENPYLQFFIGLPSFQLDEPFDHSMFAHFRKRIGMDLIRSLNENIVLDSSIKDPSDTDDAKDTEGIDDTAGTEDPKGTVNTEDKATIDPESITSDAKDTECIDTQTESSEATSTSETNEQSDDDNKTTTDASDKPSNYGKILLDATCAPSDIRYPTDLSLLDEARQKNPPKQSLMIYGKMLKKNLLNSNQEPIE